MTDIIEDASADPDLVEIIEALTPDQAQRLLEHIHGENTHLFSRLVRKAYPESFENRSRRSEVPPLQVRAPSSANASETFEAALSPSHENSPALVEIFTDGACSGNPGPGGWGALLRSGDRELEISGGEDETTNNRMELMAAIAALEALTKPSRVTITMDSNYVKDGITKWVEGWQRNGWKTAAKKDVKNRDLWERLVAAAAPHQVGWQWVRGHNGHPENERADALACAAVPRANDGWAPGL